MNYKEAKKAVEQGHKVKNVSWQTMEWIRLKDNKRQLEYKDLRSDKITTLTSLEFNTYFSNAGKYNKNSVWEVVE